MRTETKRPLLEKIDEPLPPLEDRLAWWFGIYLAAQVPLMIKLSPSASLMFPGILGITPLLLIFNIIFRSVSADIQNTMAPFILVPGFAVGYLVYLGQLWHTLKAKTRREFFRRLLHLIILLLINQLMVRAMGPITV